jgi:hypothetical protein
MKINLLHIKYQIKFPKTKSFHWSKNNPITRTSYFTMSCLLLLKFMNYMGMGNITCESKSINIATSTAWWCNNNVLTSSIQIASYVKKHSSKYDDECFMKFDWNTIIQRFEWYHSSSMGKFIYFAYGFKSQFLNSNDASSDNSNYNNEKIHCTSINSMIHKFFGSSKNNGLW